MERGAAHPGLEQDAPGRGVAQRRAALLAPRGATAAAAALTFAALAALAALAAIAAATAAAATALAASCAREAVEQHAQHRLHAARQRACAWERAREQLDKQRRGGRVGAAEHAKARRAVGVGRPSKEQRVALGWVSAIG